MARQRSPNRDKAFEIYKENKGGISLDDIDEKLGISEGIVRGWKNKDKWNDKITNQT
ncbi:phage terminase small subunit-related protein [Bacillus mycoides]|uniref:phage terminase small subunit-related protein n=1 Tax=Bacillus mycoides TaxID=1405 RepID=UPI003D64B911